MIDYFIGRIKEEMTDAKHYAERYVMYKDNNNMYSRMFRDMANDELEHAKYLKYMAQLGVESSNIKDEDMTKWTDCMTMYAEHLATIKMMLG